MGSTTVRQHYNITEEDLDVLAEKADCSQGGYRERSQRFLLKHLDADNDYLSEAQRAWVENILEEIQR